MAASKPQPGDELIRTAIEDGTSSVRIPDPSLRWGWKNSRCMWGIPFMARIYPEMQFILRCNLSIWSAIWP